MNVLISGAGLLGTYVAKCLADHGASVTIIDINPDEGYCCRILGDQYNHIEIQINSILDESFLDFILSKNHIDYIVHTAALFDPKEHYREGLLEVNLIGTELLLKKAVWYGVKKL
ncbi:NAD-dependent epimerase/dehydratase family protein [Desulfocicer niacini]